MLPQTPIKKPTTAERMVSPMIIDLCKAGQEKGYSALYEACAPYVYTIIKSYITERDAHPDMMQEVFAQLFLKLDSYDSSKGAFKYWLRRIAVNLCLMKLRKTEVLDTVIPLENHPAIYERQGYGMDIELNQLSKKDIEALLARMPGGYRTIFLLIAIDEYSHEEVSEMLGISPETSRSQYFKAKKWIRNKVMNQANAVRYGF